MWKSAEVKTSQHTGNSTLTFVFDSRVRRVLVEYRTIFYPVPITLFCNQTCRFCNELDNSFSITRKITRPLPCSEHELKHSRQKYIYYNYIHCQIKQDLS